MLYTYRPAGVVDRCIHVYFSISCVCVGNGKKTKTAVEASRDLDRNED